MHVLLKQAVTATLDLQSLDLLRTPVLLLSQDARVHHLNAAAETLFCRGQAIIGSSWDALLMVDDRLNTVLQRAREDGVVVERELVFLTSDGSEHIADLAVSFLDDHWVLEFQLLDWHRERVEQTRDSTLALAHTQVLRGLAHELNNPLGGIRGAAQLINRCEDQHERTKLANLIIGEVDRLSGLLDRFAAIPTVVAQSVDIHRLLETVRDLMAGDSTVSASIARDYDPSAPSLEADPDLLTQALLNLVRNAAQFGAERILLRTRVEHQLALGNRVYPLVMRIEIEDDGPGIDPDLEELIFLPLVSSRSGGSGLGLALSQAIARAHHGLIRCKSRPGKTVFSLLIPIQPETS